MTEPADYWHEATQKLDPELIQIFGTVGLTSLNKVDVLATVLATAKSKRNLCLRNRWKFKKSNGEIIILRDVVEKIVVWVGKFIKVGDTAAQYDPAHAALPWAAIRFLLQATVSDVQLFGATCLSLETISRLILRYQSFENLHLHRNTTRIRKLLDDALVRLYAGLLSFLGKSILYLKESTTVRVFKGITRNADSNSQALQDILDMDEEIMKIAEVGDSETLQRLEVAFARFSDGQMLSEKKLAEEQYRQFLGWLSSAPYPKYHQSYSERRILGSGKWLMDDAVYQSWCTSSSSSVLFLHGMRGSGKSTLASTIIDSHLDEIQKNQLAAPMGYFYCAGYQFEPQRSFPEEIMRSIVRQLTTSRSIPHAVRDSIWSEYEDRKTQADADGFEIEKLNTEACVKAILDVATIDPVTIIIDAVDEIQRSAQHVLLEALNKIVVESDNVVKVMITSRNNGYVFAHLSGAHDIEIQCGDNSVDIKQFVLHQVNQAIGTKRLLEGCVSKEVRNQVETMLIRGAGEMFLWADLQIQYLCEKNHSDDVLQALNQRMSTTLDDMYSESLDRLMDAGSASRDIIIRLFSWLLYAAEPLRPEVLLSIIAYDPSEGKATITMSAVVHMCAGLVIIDKHCNVVRFAHQSVQEFVRSQEIFNIRMGNRLIASSCLSTCIEGQPPSSSLAIGNQERDAYTYAAMYWPCHVRLAAIKRVNDELLQQLTEFCFDDEECAPSLLFLVWLETVGRLLEVLPNEHALKSQLAETANLEQSSFYTACTFGLTELVYLVLQKGLNPNGRNTTGQTGIYLASVAGHADTVRVLLDHGADANIPCGRFMNAIQGACFWGHEATIEALLQAGNSPRACGLYRNALEACYQGGHEDLALKLLQDADVVVNKEDYDAALQGAADVGFLRVIDWLHSPTIMKSHGQAHPTAGMMAQMQKLVKNGNVAALNRFIGSDPQSALSPFSVATAATYGREAMVEFLLDKGMNIEEPGPIGSPLRSACLGNHQRIVRLLLRRNAKLDESGAFGVGLQAAAMKGHVGTVKLLLQEGALVNQHGPPYGTALQAAAWWGHIDVLELLIDAGGNMFAQGVAKDALHAAAERGHTEIAKLLLSRHYHFQTPPRIALSIYKPPSNPYTDFEQKNELVSESLEKSADGGHEALVRLLLEHRKENTISEHEIGVAFSRAAIKGHLCVMAVFLKLKDIQPHVSRALACAISWGTKAAIEALFPPSTSLSIHELRRAVEIGIEAAAENDREARLRLVIGMGSLHCQQLEDKLIKLRGLVLILAARHQILQVVDNLMESVLLLDESDIDIALNEAWDEGHASVILCLLKHRQHDESHLYTAAGNGNDAVVRVLMERECSNTNAEEALVLAAANGHTDTVKYIVARGTDINCTALLVGARPGQPCRVSPLQAALRGFLRFYERNSTSEAPGGDWWFHPRETLLADTRPGPNPCLLGSSNWRQADENQQNELVLALLDLGADPNDLGGLERSPIQEAAEYCPENIVARLLDAGVNPLEEHNGPSALDVSIRRVRQFSRGKPSNPHLWYEKPILSGAGIVRRFIEVATPESCGNILDQLLDFFKVLIYTPVQILDSPPWTAVCSQYWSPTRILIDRKGIFQDGPGAALKAVLQRLPGKENITHDLFHKNVLQMASETDDSAFLRLLLQNGVKSQELSVSLLSNALVATSRYGYTNTARILLEAGADPSIYNTEGVGALECAVTNQHAPVVELLLRHIPAQALSQQAHETFIVVERVTAMRKSTNRRKKLKAKRPFGFRHLLYIAARNGDASTVNHLLQTGADCTAPSTDAQDEPQPLLAACMSGSIEVVRLLLEGGALPDIVGMVPNGNWVRSPALYNPIHLACRHGHMHIIRLLLDYGAHVDGVTLIHRTPLMVAVGNGRLDIIRLLLDAGAQIDMVRRGKTAFSVAVRRGDAVVVDALLQAGAVGVDGALGRAASHEWACIQDLPSDGKTLQTKASLREQEIPALAWALSRAMKDCNKEMFETLFKYSSRPFDHIHDACCLGSVVVLQQLAKGNESIFDEKIDKNKSALQVAASYGHLEAVKFLFKEAVNPRNSRLDFMQISGAGVVAASEAALGCWLNSAFGLFASKNIHRRAAHLPVNAQSWFTKANGRSAAYAKIEECWSAVCYLIQNGAPCDGKSALFGSTLKMAIMTGASKTARQLLSAGFDPKNLELDKFEASMFFDVFHSWSSPYREMKLLHDELGISSEGINHDNAGTAIDGYDDSDIEKNDKIGNDDYDNSRDEYSSITSDDDWASK